MPIIENEMKESDLELIIKGGILAPSADNLQPWKFKILSDQIDFFLDLKHTQNFCDEGLFAPYLSAGAVIENIRLAAAENDYYLSPSYFPNQKDINWVASLRFIKNNINKFLHFHALQQRLTNRKFYSSSRKIDTHVYSKLQNLVQEESDFNLIWIKKDDSKYKKLSQILGKADQLRFENKRLHDELMQTMRFNHKDVTQTQDGLDFRTLETAPGSIFLFKLMSEWNRQTFLNQLGLSQIFNLYTQLQLRSSQACGLIVSKLHSPINYVRGGEVMERLWHEVTLQNLSLQPMEALPIFLINLKETGCPQFTRKQKSQLQNLKSTFYSLFSLQETNGLIFLFRIGYAEPPKFRSLRRPVESFLMK